MDSAKCRKLITSAPMLSQKILTQSTLKREETSFGLSTIVGDVGFQQPRSRTFHVFSEYFKVFNKNSPYPFENTAVRPAIVKVVVEK